MLSISENAKKVFQFLYMDNTQKVQCNLIENLSSHSEFDSIEKTKQCHTDSSVLGFNEK